MSLFNRRERTISIVVAAAMLAVIATGVGADTGAPTQPVTPAGLAGRPLQQIAMTTTDLDRARHFYGDLLGLPVLFESNNMLFFDIGGTRLMIALDEARRTPARPTSIIYFDATAFDETLLRLKALPVKLVGPVETVQSTASGELKLQQFVDPDGNALAIMGLVPHPPAPER